VTVCKNATAERYQNYFVLIMQNLHCRILNYYSTYMAVWSFVEETGISMKVFSTGVGDCGRCGDKGKS
jgi:hypothetical protein